MHYRGRLRDYVYQLMGGIRSGMGYLGAHTVPEMAANARILRVTAAGIRESHPHDVTITREAPNYSVE